MEQATDRWIMVRIDRATHAKLLAVKQRMEADHDKSPMRRYETVDRFGLSLDSVIRELIRRDEAHKTRSKKSSAKRRKEVKVEVKT